MSKMSKPPSLSPAEIQRSLGRTKALAEAAALKPSVSDYVSEGVLDHSPETDAEGRINVKVTGHKRVVRMLQMNERHYARKGELGQELQGRIRRVPMRGRDGRVRMVAEEREDVSGRKHGAVRIGTVLRWGRPLPPSPDGTLRPLSLRAPWPWEKQA